MARIAIGVDPWIAYRNFLEDWTHQPDARAGLARPRPKPARPADRQWAALLAATVEALCARDAVPVPAWTRDPAYKLPEPWFLYEGTGRMREWQRESTPGPFADRNIWSGDRLLRRT